MASRVIRSTYLDKPHKLSHLPLSSYGVLEHTVSKTYMELAVEQIKTIGYAIIPSNYSEEKLNQISFEFDRLHQIYLSQFSNFMDGPEKYLIRAPFLVETKSSLFLNLALNKNVIKILKMLIGGRFILNQQNGVINPPLMSYSQGKWHRDLPYQHFISSRPLAINALFCVDDFTEQNGATFILPGSHKNEKFPSQLYIDKNAMQIEAPRGSFVILDCMVFHSGGYNNTLQARRGVNHVYNIPYFKQQINIPKNLNLNKVKKLDRSILGFDDIEPESISILLEQREYRDGSSK